MELEEGEILDEEEMKGMGGEQAEEEESRVKVERVEESRGKKRLRAWVDEGEGSGSTSKDVRRSKGSDSS